MLPFEHSLQVRVRYAETDRMGIVWHGSYWQYFELGRTEALRARGWSYRAIEESGVHLPVVEAGITYRASATYDDLLTVTTRVSEPPTVRLRFDYVITHATGEVVVTGFTVLAFVDAATHRPRRPPIELRALYSAGPHLA